MEKKILVVDDEKPIADILQFNLKKEGFDVYCAYDGNEALKMVEESSARFNLIRYYVASARWHGGLPRSTQEI